MADIGFATVSIVPSARGFGSSLNSQISGPLSASGRTGGLSLGKSLIAGFAGAGIGVAVGKVVGAAVGFIGDSVSKASNLQQSIGGVDAVFKGSAQTIHNWAQGASSDVGLSEDAYNVFAAKIGSMLKGAGVPMAQLAGKTNNLIKLGSDLSATYGGTTAGAVDALGAALRGEFDPLEQFGVSLNQNAINAEGARLGFEQVNGSLTAQGKQAATLSLIYKRTADAQGQFGQQSNTLAEQQQILGAQFDNLKAKLGTALLPALSTIVGAISSRLGPALEQLGPKIGPAADKISQFVSDVGKNIPGVIAVLAPIGQTIVSAFGPAIKILSGAGTAVTPLGIALQALAPVLPQLVSNFAQLAGTVATTLAQGLVVVAPILTTILSAIVQFAAPILASKDALGLLAAGFIAFKVATTVFAVLPGLINGFRIAMGLLRATTAIASIAQVAFNVALTANPIGIVVALIAGLVAGLVFFFTQTKLGQSIWANFTKFLGEAFKNVGAVISTVWTAITTAFSTALNFISGIVTTVWGAVTAAFQAAVTFIQGVIGAVVSFIQQHWQLLLAIFLGPLGLIIDFIVTNFGTIRSVITTVIGFVVGYIQTQVRIWQTVFTVVVGAIKAVVTTGFNAAKSVISSVMGAIRTVITTIWNAIKSVVTSVLNGIRTTITTVWNAAKAAVTSAVNGIRSIITSVFNTARSIVQSVMNTIRSVISSVWNAAQTATSGALGRMVSAVSSGIGRILAFFGSLAGKIVGAIGNAAGMLVSVGHNIIQGLINGLTSAAGAIAGVIKGIVNNAINVAKNLFGIHSPSTVFHSIGSFVMQGLVNGIKDNADKVSQTMSNLTTKVKDAFAKAAAEIKASNAKIVKDNQALALARAQASGFTKKTSRATRLANAQRQANLRADIKLNQQIIASDKKVNTAANQKSLLAAISKANGQLQALANQRDAISDDLKAATDKLNEAVKVRDDFSANVQKAVTDMGNVANLFKDATDAILSATNSMTDAQKSLTDLDGKIADDNSKRADLMASLQAAINVSTTSTSKIARTQALSDISDLTKQLNDLDSELSDYADQRNTLLGNIADYSAQSNKSISQSIIDSLQNSIAQTNSFTAALKTLRSQGLDDATYQQIIAAGVAGGGLATAQGLLAGGPNAVKQIAALQAQLSAAGATLGTQTSSSLYQAGVDAAQGIVDGLQSQQDKIVAQMEHIADALVTSIKTKLDIHSPSKVLHKIGLFTGEGMANGLKATAGLIQKASDVLMPNTSWASPNSALTPGLSSVGGGSSNTNFNYTQVGGQGLTAEQELVRAGRVLRQKMRGR